MEVRGIRIEIMTNREMLLALTEPAGFGVHCPGCSTLVGVRRDAEEIPDGAVVDRWLACCDCGRILGDEEVSEIYWAETHAA